MVKYLGATNNRGSRVRLTDTRFKGKTKTIPYDYELRDINDMAQKYLNSIGFMVIGQCEVGVICDSYQGSFQSLI